MKFKVVSTIRQQLRLYSARRRQRKFERCDEAALDNAGSDLSRERARASLYQYIRPLCEIMPSFCARRIDFTPPDSFAPLNPSVAVMNGQICVLLRSVNYIIDEHGRYLIRNADGEANYTNQINTRNFLLRLRQDFSVETQIEIKPPANFPRPAFDLVGGFEDMRLFNWKGSWWINACVREQNPEGWSEQWLANINTEETDALDTSVTCATLSDARPMLPEYRRHEKNWMPWVDGDTLEFVYRLGQTVDSTGKILSESPTGRSTDHISGGSQVIPFKTGFLSVVHETRLIQETTKRYYQHRFVWYDRDHRVHRITRPFYFHGKEIEFVAGVALHPDGERVIISYGREDKEAWIATVDANELSDFIWHDQSS